MKFSGDQKSEVVLDAVYQDGVIRPVEPFQVPENTKLRVTVELADELTPAHRGNNSPWIARFPNLYSSLQASLKTINDRNLSISWGRVLFGLALLLYAMTRLWRLSHFPIYFFSDEAIHPVLAEELIRDGFRNSAGMLFPAYFQNYSVWNLSLSVYTHLLPVALFSKSVFVTRATSAIVSLVGVAAVGLIMKFIFRARLWWTSVLVMAAIPAWFLHSRTAFETVLMVSFYALFLLFYLLYRYRSPRFLYPAIVFAAATFYAYANGQAVIGSTAILLFLSDFRYHVRHRGVLAKGTILIVLLTLPYLRFRIEHPTALTEHLRTQYSYWLQDLPLTKKITHYAETYAYGLSPGYWFFPNDHDLIRHRMKDYGHILPEMLPLALLGLGICLWNVRSSAHRAIVLAVLASPVGAATVDIGITRVLSFVVPAVILVTLGLAELLDWITSRISYPIVVGSTFVLLSVTNLWMLRDALINGPLWYDNYGLYGMQYGAQQLFSTIPEYLDKAPDIQVVLSASWANGTDMFPRFFLSGEDLKRLRIQNIDSFLVNKQPTEKRVVILPAWEYERARSSNKFKNIEVEQVLPYPDGSPGFYFVRLTYVDNINSILAAEREVRRRPVESVVEIHGERLPILHSPFDMGEAQHMFDGDIHTLARVMEANPAVVEISFLKPRKISQLAGDFGSMEFSWKVQVYAPDSEEPTRYTTTFRNTPPDPHAEINFERGPDIVSKIHMEILDLHSGESAKIHIRELALKTD